MRSLNRRLLLLLLLLLSASGVLAGRLTLDERRIPLQGQDNFRDLGGYVSDDGRRLKTGVFYRSGALHALTDSDLELLTKLGIKTVIELRSAREVESIGRDRLPEKVKPVVLPLSVAAFDQPVQEAIEGGNIALIPPDLHQQLARSLIRDYSAELRQVLELALDPANQPVVIHCDDGGLRTGVVSMLLLVAMGVPMDTIKTDFLLTNIYRETAIRLQMNDVLTRIAMKSGQAPGLTSGSVESLFFLQERDLEAAVEEASRRHGSVEGYLLRGLKLPGSQIEQWRSSLME